MDTTILKEIGMTKSEIKVYFALMKLEKSTVGPIIKNAGISDSKIYEVLDKLKKRGLVGYVIKNNVRHYQASNPNNILKMLDEKNRKIEKEKKILKETIIPQIRKRMKITEDRQEAVIYESAKGVRSAFDYLLEEVGKNKEYQVFMIDIFLEFDKVVKFFNPIHRKRRKMGIKVRLISNLRMKKIIEKKWKKMFSNVRYTKQEIPAGIFIFNNHVMTLIWGDNPTAFVIKSKLNYEYYKKFFEYIWKNSRR